MKVTGIILALASLVVLTSAASSAVPAGRRVVCYFASWTVYRPGNGKFDVSDIDPTLCTHIMFGFIGLTSEGKIDILDGWESDDDGYYKGFQHLVGLKQDVPGLKVLVSMGGWNEGSEVFSIVAANATARQTLVADVLSFLQLHSFDGLDLDWEYPGLRDTVNPEDDPANYVTLLKEFRAALNPRGYLLTAAVSGGVPNMDVAYPDVKAISDVLDIINVMVYDFHGAFEDFVGHTAPLYPSSLDDPINATLNVATGIQHWIDKGGDVTKMVLGVGTYGRSFTLADASNTSLYAPNLGGGIEGPYTRQDGVLGYNEICELHSDWTYVWDDEQKVPHRISGDQWVGYDDMTSIELKVEFANSKNLSGIMIWAFDTDDFQGLCGDGAYPLLHTVARTLT